LISEPDLSEDVFLDKFDQGEKHRLIGKFAQFLREGQYSTSSRGYDELVPAICAAAVEGVAQAFIAKLRPDPRLDADGKPAFHIQRQWKGYRPYDFVTKAPGLDEEVPMSLPCHPRWIGAISVSPAASVVTDSP
jgi:hypothetical protein